MYMYMCVYIYGLNISSRQCLFLEINRQVWRYMRVHVPMYLAPWNSFTTWGEKLLQKCYVAIVLRLTYYFVCQRNDLWKFSFWSARWPESKHCFVQVKNKIELNGLKKEKRNRGLEFIWPMVNHGYVRSCVIRVNSVQFMFS